MINLMHDVDVLRFLFGNICNVNALGTGHIRQAGRVESSGILLTFTSGVTAAVNFTDTAPRPWGFEAGTGENLDIATTGDDIMCITVKKGGISFPSMTKWDVVADWSKLLKPHSLPYKITEPLNEQLDHSIDLLERKVSPLIFVFEATKTLDITLQIKALLAQDQKNFELEVRRIFRFGHTYKIEKAKNH